MDIGYSPRCAEGGESAYLTLFVEDGRQLKPVLKDLPTCAWRIAEGSSGYGDANADYTRETVAVTLEVLPTVTEGWHDLEVTAHRPIETTNGAAEAPGKPATKTQVLGTLRAKGRPIGPTRFGAGSVRRIDGQRMGNSTA